MINKEEIITEVDRIVGLNNDVTDGTHTELVNEISNYIETVANKLPKHLSNDAYRIAKGNSYNYFVEWWDSHN